MEHEPKKCQICKTKIKHGHIKRHEKACEKKWLKSRKYRTPTCLYCQTEFKKGGNLKRHLKRNACGAHEYVKSR